MSFNAKEEFNNCMKDLRSTPGKYYTRILEQHGKKAAKEFFEEVRKYTNNQPRRF